MIVSPWYKATYFPNQSQSYDETNFFLLIYLIQVWYVFPQHLFPSKSSENAGNHRSKIRIPLTNCGSSYIPNLSPLTKATELVPILLRAGSNVNAQRTNDGFSALHVAAMVGRLEVANLLLQVVFYCWLLIVRFTLQTYQMMHRLK